jgi:hypothetical protein
MGATVRMASEVSIGRALGIFCDITSSCNDEMKNNFDGVLQRQPRLLGALRTEVGNHTAALLRY